MSQIRLAQFVITRLNTNLVVAISCSIILSAMIISRCTKCDFVFQHPLPTLEQIASFYPNEYEVYEEQSRLKKVSAFRKSILKKYYGYTHLNTSSIIDLLSGIATSI